MRILAVELQKLFSSKVFLLIIAVVFVLNGYLVFRTANSGDAKPEQYKAVYEEIEGLSDAEKLQWLDERLNEYDRQQGYSWIVLAELYDECADIVGYSEYLDSIDSQAESMTRVSIFAKPDTFNYRSIVKTPSAYKKVRDVVLVFDISKGVNLATDNSFTDILCGFIVLFAVLSLMISDREQGISGLLFALKRGRGRLLLTKLTALAITVFCAVSLIYAENLIIMQSIYGLGNLSRPVQSISGFIGCNLKISVFQYLFLYVIFKSLAMFTIGSLLSMIAVNTKNTVQFYGISAIILISEGVLYAVIHPLSVYSIFRYINLISFTEVNEIFCNYKNINFFGYPIPLIPTATVALIIITLITAELSVIFYAKKRNLEFKKINFKFKINKSQKIHSPIYYTFNKSLILQNGLVIIAIFIALSAFMSENFVKKYDITDVYYRYYTELLNGQSPEEVKSFIADETRRFDELNTKASELMQTSDGLSAELKEIQKQLAPRSGFYLLKERFETIKNIKNTQIFYDTGYKRMFGVNGYNDDMKYSLLAVMLCIFLISPMISNDNKYRMMSVINATSSGNRRYIRRNIAVSAIYGIISAMLWLIPYTATVSQYYGFSGLNSSIRSIIDFADFSINMSVLQYLLMIYLLRTLALIICSLIMLWISSECRNITTAVLINSAVFALPVAIYLFGAKIMVNVGFNAMLSVNIIFNNISFIHFLPAIVLLTAFISDRYRYTQL